MHRYTSTLCPLLLVCPLAILGVGSGCGSEGSNDSLGDETGGGQEPETEDNPCCEDPGDSSWWCGCYVEVRKDVWQWQTYGEPQLCVSESQAATYCASVCSPVPSALEWRLTDIWCVYPWDPATPNCTYWDPANEVNYSGGTHYMDYGFVASLVSDPEPVMYCDNALVLKRDSADGFKVANADSGELLYEIGLRDDDIIVSINGMPLDNYDDVVDAVNALWYGGETSYTLELERNSATVYLQYQVVYTL